MTEKKTGYLLYIYVCMYGIHYLSCYNVYWICQTEINATYIIPETEGLGIGGGREGGSFVRDHCLNAIYHGPKRKIGYL